MLDLTAKNQYQKISQLIQEEKERQYEGAISSMVRIIIADSSKENVDTTEIPHQNEISIIALLCLRIQANCSLIRSGCREHLKQLTQDISDVIENVKTIEYWETTKNIGADSLNLILSVCPEHKAIVYDNVSFSTRMSHKRERMLSEAQYDLFCYIAEYYIRLNRDDVANRILTRLCEMAQSNNDDLFYRNLIVMIMARFCEKNLILFADWL